MPYIHSVKIDRKTGELIGYKVSETKTGPNHEPLVAHMLNQLEKHGILSTEKEG
jgi:hypothetical protein